jgi:hypothetical protein
MLSAPHSIPFFARTTALFMAALLLVAPSARQDVSKAPPASASQTVVFFPPAAIDGWANFFSQYLSYFNEPSLLAAAQDSSALSYRLESIAGRKAEVLAVRISLSSDGGARVVAVEQSGTPPILHRTEHSASAAQVKTFLQFVDKADFWSMRAIESGKGYYTDSDTWIFEGVRNGTYHVVLRAGRQSRPFVDMVRFLAKELAKLDESDIPH